MRQADVVIKILLIHSKLTLQCIRIHNACDLRIIIRLLTLVYLNQLNMEDTSLDLGFGHEKIDTDFNSSTASPTIGGSSGVAEIFYAPESTRLSFSEKKDLTIEEEIFDEKEIEKAIQLGVEVDEKEIEDNSEQEENSSVLDADWKEKEKHVFILSEAGKPIYTL